MSCGITDPKGCIVEGIKGGVDHLAETFKGGADWAMKTLTTSWLKTPSPDLTSANSPVVWMQAHMNYLVLASVFASVCVAAYRLATSGSFDHLGELGQSLARVLVVGALAATATSLAVQVGDLFTDWILDRSQTDISAVVVLSAVQNPGIVILLAIIVILAQFIQWGLMLARNGMIILLVGSLPLAAAAGNTQMGKQYWQKSLAWLIAFVLYKPTAALIYAACFKMASKDQDISTQLSGICMMLLAIFALPALMRFLVPATSAMGGGNAGAMAGAVVGAAVATGAVVATGGAAGAAGAGSGFSGGTSMTGGGQSPAPTGSAPSGHGESPLSGGSHSQTAVMDRPQGDGGGGLSSGINTVNTGRDVNGSASRAADGAVGEDEE